MKLSKQIFWFIVLVIIRTPAGVWEHLQAEFERFKDLWEEAED